jgi:tetratricopeptide (TPR) repeat protein
MIKVFKSKNVKPKNNDILMEYSPDEFLLHDFINRNKKILFAIFFTLCAFVISFWAVNRYRQSDAKIAESQMFEAVYKFENGNFDEALNGNETNKGFLYILKNYSSTNSANLAKLYIGLIYLQKGMYKQAFEILSKFKSADYSLNVIALAAMADSMIELNQYSDAAKLYKKAALYKINDNITPIYLEKAALSYEADENLGEALECLNRIANDFPNSSQYEFSVKNVSKINALQSNK